MSVLHGWNGMELDVFWSCSCSYGGVGLRDFAAGRLLSGESDLERDLERERLRDLDLERLLLLRER